VNMQAPDSDQTDKTELLFTTGWGQHDTHASTLKDGKPNPHKSAGTPYTGISGRDLVAMVRNPQSCAKESAQWFIPSTYCQHDGRSHTAQRENGAFWWLGLDIDPNNLDLSEVLATVLSVTGECGLMIYSTSSATAECRKWRALVPLQRPITGADYTDTARAYFDMLEEESKGVLIPDPALKRTGQVIYLPNKRGDFYECHIGKGARLDLTADHPIIKRREKTRAEQAEAQREAEKVQARHRAERGARGATDEAKPGDVFNDRHAVVDLLTRYGYTRAGQSNHWRSRYQASGTYATECHGDYWISISGSDAAAEIGKATANGNRYGDAFDLFVHYEHGGNFNASVRAYGQELRAEQMRDEWTFNGATEGEAKPTGTNLPDDPDLSQDALATQMGLAGWDANAKYVATWGKWVMWTGTHWQIDNKLDHLTRTRQFLRQKAKDMVEWAERKAAEIDAKEGEDKGGKLRKWSKDQANNLRSKVSVAAVEGLARSNPASIAGPNDFDENRMILGTPGGTVDLRTGHLRPALRSDMVTKQTSVAPAQPGAVPMLWLRFLSDVFDGDQELVDFMQRGMGYALTGMTTEHKLLFPYGTGRNGKSTLLGTALDIWGDYGRRAPAAAFLSSQTERHSTDIAGLHGARLVVGSELPKGKTWDEAVIKDLTGGDRMSARFMRQDNFDFDPQLTLMIAGNNMPSFRGVDEAIRARVLLVPFTVTIPAEKRDKDLPEKLKAEAPAILRWAIDGALLWQKRGLDAPPSIIAASAEYFDDEDTLAQFLGDETTQDATGFVTYADLHQRFVQWMQTQGLNAWTLRTLQKEVKGRGWAEHRTKSGRGFVGMRLR
jgi:P4 family phage/plasmid primase-like protien